MTQIFPAVLLVVPLVSACKRSTAPAELDGPALYRNACARCHGPDGRGGAAVAPGAVSRNFVDHAFQASRSDAQLRDAIVRGQGGGAMPAFGAVMTEAELGRLVARVRSFDPEAR